MTQPAFRPGSIALVLLSLSIGWGIRGNYGHEAGAMIPGALAAVAMAVVSGREDWRARMPFFALFGALGWAFGGSISYMLPPSYTETGHFATQVYGFASTYFEGFLWAGLGGAATAYAAVEDRARMTALIKPLCWVLGIWWLQYVIQDTPFHLQDRLFAAFGADRSEFRQRDPLYWLDSEWLEAVLALVALGAFDLWERRFSRFKELMLFAVGGASLGWGAQALLASTGTTEAFLSWISHPQGDLTLLDPATGVPRFKPEDLLNNWPVLFSKTGSHLGWVLGLIVGLTAYFRQYGAWTCESGLLVRMALGSLLVFLIGPVLLSNLPVFREVGGFRLTPPRGDSWANILGCYIGWLLHFRRRGQKPLVFTALLAGVLGGVALTTAQMVKILCFSLGNPRLTSDPAVVQAWQHWRSANWHSIALEQFAGLLYGLAVLVPLGILASRLPLRKAEPRIRPWTEWFAVVFVFNVVGYINIVKNVRDWTEPRRVSVNGEEGVFRSVAEVLRAPLVGSIEWRAWTWFTVAWILMTLCTCLVLWRHRRERLALIPRTWLGKGQVFYLGFLWLIVIANFTKALVAFSDGRIATEGTTMFNALICTALILCSPRETESGLTIRCEDLGSWTRTSTRWLVGTLVATTVLYTAAVRGLYGDQWNGSGGNNLRSGPKADWRVKPILKSKKHN